MVTNHRKTLDRARSLRHNHTDAERRLWGYLRNKSLQGYKFNRQVPVGIYIADFLCREAMLIVEVDGATHGNADEIKYDEKRTVFLTEKGYRVIRCANLEVFENLIGVLDTILIALRER
jgi:very-short-patch-repair endonuclease